MFKFRSGGQGGSSPTQPPSIEALRRRARQRLLGAGVLVFAGVLGFPLLFESQPRQVPVDFEVEIPSRKNAKSLIPDAPPPGVRIEGLDAAEETVAAAEEASRPAAVGSAVVAGAAAVATVAGVAATAAALPAAAPAPQARPSPSQSQSQAQASAPIPAPLRPKPEAAPPKLVEAPRPEAKPADKPVPKPVEQEKPADKDKPAAKPAGDAARALALLEDKPGKAVDPDKASAAGRHVVQVGAFADPEKAREVRQKIEQAGLPTYTHVADTPDGKRTRVRLGPFATRAEAEKTAAKLKTLGLSSAIFSL